jgi:hypothetical protein
VNSFRVIVGKIHISSPLVLLELIAMQTNFKRAQFFIVATVAAQVAVRAWASDFKIGPLIEVSRDPDPLAGCDTGFRPPGNMNFDDEFETRVAVDPSNTRHLVVTWVGHDLQVNFVGVSFDGGATWQETALPGITTCTGGPYIAAVDNYLRSIAPNGDIYLASVGFSGSSAAILVNKSTDGGLTWTMPITIDRVNGAGTFDDKPATTADPSNSLIAYVAFERAGNSGTDSTLFSRTTDGGRTWETAREIANPGSKNANTGHQILVLPDGSLVLFFSHEERHGGWTYTTSLATLRSRDSGLTWLPANGPILGPEIKSIDPADPTIGATDPDTGVALYEYTAAVAFAAMDRQSGALYAVWEDSRFSQGKYNSIAFSQSLDGGLTWSEPIRINGTPNNIPPTDQQAFRPSIAVASDGTIGVTYYDFRFNDANPGTLTDYWFVGMRPTPQLAATDPLNWKDEVRLTDSSFDLQTAPIFFGGEFVGDSDGLAAAGNDFVAVWCMPAGVDQGNIYFRRVGP